MLRAFAEAVRRLENKVYHMLKKLMELLSE